MTSMKTLATVALLGVIGAANAQTERVNPVCVANQTANANVIARAQAAATPAQRQAILQAAISANPANAVCLADLALQMSLTNVDPAAGPEEFVGTDVATTTEGTPAPAENPNQLNQPAGTLNTSPAAPAL